MQVESLPDLTTERLRIRLLEFHEAGLMAAFRVANRTHLEIWEPRRNPEFFTRPFWEIQVRIALRDYRQGNSCCLTIMNRAEDEILGICNFTNIIRGTFQSCHLGYALAEQEQGQGYMEEALVASIDYMFRIHGLHRIMANYLPRNNRSGALLKRLGFEVEGHAKRYLLINGKWEDHVLTSLINPCSVD